jgi:hypothetical protein
LTNGICDTAKNQALPRFFELIKDHVTIPIVDGVIPSNYRLADILTSLSIDRDLEWPNIKKEVYSLLPRIDRCPGGRPQKFVFPTEKS